MNTDYKIKSVEITTNGRNEIYFDIEWVGDSMLDYYELRVWESGKDNCLEVCAYAEHKQRVTVKDYCFMTDWKSKEVNKEAFHIELGIADYDDNGKELSWKVLADYQPIEVNLYYEMHIFRKNVLEIR